MELVIKIFWQIARDAKIISTDNGPLFRMDLLGLIIEVFILYRRKTTLIVGRHLSLLKLIVDCSLEHQWTVWCHILSYDFAIWFSFLQFDFILFHEIHHMIQFAVISVMQDLQNRTLLSLFFTHNNCYLCGLIWIRQFVFL